MPSREGPLIALTAHLDTVLAPRTKEDISIDREGDMRGPGVSDNGAGLAALLAVAKAHKIQRPIPPDIWNRLLLVANVGEEGEGDLCGIRHICRQTELIRADSRVPGSRWRRDRPYHHSGPRQPPLRDHILRRGRP